MAPETSDEVILRFDEPDGHRSLILEDDGKVAYAYLLENGLVVGDVWLYNVGADPHTTDWSDASAMPFRNPEKYCTAETLPRLGRDAAITCTWSTRGVAISVGGSLWARLESGSKPGWSRKARVRGPLAQPLESY
jgi:hypothetical protein